MTLALTKISETASKITLGWTPVAGAIGYRFQSATQAPKWSHTWNDVQSQVTFGKAAWYKVEALGVESAGEYPSQVLPGDFGALLPPRIAESPGSVVNVSTLAQLSSQIASAPNGSIINITTSINAGGAQTNFSRNATAAAPITITSNPGVVISNVGSPGTAGWYVTGSYLRFRGLEFANTAETIKPTSPAHHIEIDGCYFHNVDRQGILTSAAAGDIQIWNTRIHNVGNDFGLDHGIYFAYGAANCVIANCLIYDPNLGYGLQLYPNVQNLIVTCCTIDGGLNTYGGVVLGSEGSPTTRDFIGVGNLLTNSPLMGWRVNNPLGPNNNLYDSIAFNNASGNYQTATNMTYTDCVAANPLYVNRTAKDFRLQAGSPAIGHIAPARYGYVPQTDIDGNVRVTADAGCYTAGA